MPAGPASAPRGVPGRLAGLGALPQHKVERISLGQIHLDARAGAQVGQALAGEPPVALEARHRIHHIAIGADVGVVTFDELAHHVDDLRHVLRGARLVIGWQHAEALAILVHGVDEALRQGLDWFAVLGRAPDDLVIDIGDVAHIGQPIAPLPQVTAHHIEYQEHARMSDVYVVVHGEPAHVHAQRARDDGPKLLLMPAEGVVDADHAKRARRSRALPGGIALSRGASSGPCARAGRATRTGRYRSAPLRPVAARSAPAIAGRSLPSLAAAAAATEK